MINVPHSHLKHQAVIPATLASNLQVEFQRD
jgi:hypothetical protein